MQNKVGLILVLFILLVIIACSCGVLGNNERKEDRKEDRKEEKKDDKHNHNNYVGGCGCGLGY